MKALIDIIPARGRKYVYAILAGALTLYGVWRAVEGDWSQFAVSVATAAVNVMAASNTNGSSAIPYVSTVTGDPMIHVTLPDGTEQHRTN